MATDFAFQYKSQVRYYMATLCKIPQSICQDFRRFHSIGKREARLSETNAQVAMLHLAGSFAGEMFTVQQQAGIGLIELHPG